MPDEEEVMGEGLVVVNKKVLVLTLLYSTFFDSAGEEVSFTEANTPPQTAESDVTPLRCSCCVVLLIGSAFMAPTFPHFLLALATFLVPITVFEACEIVKLLLWSGIFLLIALAGKVEAVPKEEVWYNGEPLVAAVAQLAPNTLPVGRAWVTVPNEKGIVIGCVVDGDAAGAFAKVEVNEAVPVCGLTILLFLGTGHCLVPSNSSPTPKS